ncbi:ATP-binding protein [Novosphingobium sp.]|uniref:ATP-binding protein n=1 Tax=Novosphingobium sp. TaxID=1874826 RepID=UPI0031E428C4
MIRRWLGHLWPSSLSMRIACILVAGLVLTQVLTSTIWFESRRRQMLEIPTRVFATRVADSLRLLSTQPDGARQAMLQTLTTPGFAPSLSMQLPAPVTASGDQTRIAPLLAQVIRLHLGRPVEVRVIDAALMDENNRPAGSLAMMTAHDPTASFLVAARLSPQDPWLIARGQEDENGADLDRAGTILDYILRIYLLRILIVVALTLLAVRLAMNPLKRMGDAAEALRRDIHSPPLQTCGPREVRGAAEAFNAMQRQIIENMEERSRFLAAISHDLRSPITRLRLRSEMLPSEALRASFRADLSDMEEMVDATLSFARSGVEDSVREMVDLDLMLAMMVANLAGQAVTLTGQVGRPIHGFPQSLRRCVQNLLDNALRYAGSAEIHASGDKQIAVIEIRDHGPGIADDQLEAVFEPFYRLEHSRNADLGGVGLGLSIARKIALAHGGSLTLRNRAEGGLSVHLAIPHAVQDA